MKKYLLALLILMVGAGNCPAFSSAMQVGASSDQAAEGCTNPTAGTVLLGAATTQSAYYATSMVANTLVCGTALTATWAETCSTTSLTALKGRGSSGGAGNAKLVLYNSLREVVASATSATNSEADYTYTFTFSSAPTITKNATYYICTILDSDYVYVPALDSSSNQISSDDTGTYTSPPSIMTLNDTGDTGTLGMWGVK